MTIISSHGKFVVVHEILIDNIKNIYIYIFTCTNCKTKNFYFLCQQIFGYVCIFGKKKVFCKML